MRKFILNIGHARKNKTHATLNDVIRALVQSGFIIDSIEVAQSDTEPTSVVAVSHHDQRNGINGYIRGLASMLGQEVIATLHVETGKGVMLGATIDLDDAWGDFNPSLFIMPGGQRLAPKQEAA